MIVADYRPLVKRLLDQFGKNLEKRELTVLNTVLPESIYFEPPSKNGREERQDAAQNRQRVLETARRLFNERGVEAITMTEIATEARIGKGTLYRRYPDKGALCMALVDQATRNFQDKVLAYLRDNWQESDPLTKLGWFLGELVSYTEENSAYLKPAQEAGGAFHKTPYFSLPVYQWQRGLVLLLMNEAATSRAGRPEQDRDFLADALLAPLQLDLYLYQRQTLGYSLARIANGLRQLLEGF